MVLGWVLCVEKRKFDADEVALSVRASSHVVHGIALAEVGAEVCCAVAVVDTMPPDCVERGVSELPIVHSKVALEVVVLADTSTLAPEAIS